MKIKELFKQKQSDLQKYKPVTIAFLERCCRLTK